MSSNSLMADALCKCIEASSRAMPSEAEIGMRLMAQLDRLSDAFYEITTLLSSDAERQTFFSLVMSSAAPWSLQLEPEVAARRVEQLHLNRQIAAAAELLGGMLLRREELQDTDVVPATTLFWPADVLARVFKETGRHTDVTDGLAALQATHPITQWPSMFDACKVIAMNAAATPTPVDQAPDAVTNLPPRERARRFVHTLMNAMYLGNGHVQLLPEDFALSDPTLAALTNVALNLPPPSAVQAVDVRALRPWIYVSEEEP